MSIIKEGMAWPPLDMQSWKMAEHSAWYSGDAEVLANFYTQWANQNITDLPYRLNSDDMFWGRQIKNQGDIYVHVPIAGDIAETSSNFLFAESPSIRLMTDNMQSPFRKAAQLEFDNMRQEIMLNSKILEAAESAAAIGGIFIKIAIDEELSKYPIPVIEQADKAIPEFRFGILTAVTFWEVIERDDSGSKVYRLLERYEKGAITYTLYLGTDDRLGKKVELNSHEETMNLDDIIELSVDELLAIYVPNMLPNRLNRSSYLGRSDLSGIEGLMDSLDETFSCWMKDIALAQAKVFIPEQYLQKQNGKLRYNIDQMMYVELDVDPVVEGGNNITATQFAIRADEFEKTTLNLLDRIISSAGYSPQSFGLNIQGRAESGTALSMRERKSFLTKIKKEKYWNAALDKLVKLLILVYKFELKGKIETDLDINIEFNDGITNNMNETATAIQMLANAQALSTKTKVKLLHPDWEEEQIDAEVAVILEENRMEVPDFNLDLEQIKYEEQVEGDE